VRRAVTPDGREFTLADTVGFVRQLPTQLVEAFRSTLEEVSQSDLVLHVVDGAHPDPEGQLSAVRTVLAEVGGDKVPELIVINKCDAADPDVLDRLLRREKSSIAVSAKTGQGIPELIERPREPNCPAGCRRPGSGPVQPGRPGEPDSPGGRRPGRGAHRPRAPGSMPGWASMLAVELAASSTDRPSSVGSAQCRRVQSSSAAVG
jgi:hypothetical protein